MPADTPPHPPQDTPDTPTFEGALEQLETLIARIESGDIGLEASLTQHEQGTRLIKHCRAILDTAESRIAELQIGSDPPRGADDAGDDGGDDTAKEDTSPDDDDDDDDVR